LTCEGVEDYKTEADPDKWVFGARYTHPLCPEFPHFEVKIFFTSLCLERMIRTKDQMFLGYDRGLKKMRKLSYSQADWLA